MQNSGSLDDRDRFADPQGAASRYRAAATTAGQLEERGITLAGDESAEELAQIAEAVEAFEKALSRAGGDSYTNSPTSSQPDDPAMVLPTRSSGEPVGEYTRRIRSAAARLGEQG